MTKPHRKRYGLGSFFKKIGRGAKKIIKSPIGKAALLGGLGYYGASKAGGIGNLWSKLAGTGLGKWVGGLSAGQKILGGLGIAAVGTPYMQKLLKTGPYMEDDTEEEDWTIQSPNLANLLARTKNYYRNYDPSSSDLSFQPAKQFVDPTFYSAKGGRAGLWNGGPPGGGETAFGSGAEIGSTRRTVWI